MRRIKLVYKLIVPKLDEILEAEVMQVGPMGARLALTLQLPA